MRVSIAFLLHLAGFGVLSATIVTGFILDRRIRRETELSLKLYAAGLARLVGLLSPFAAILLLATGIANIHHRFLGSTTTWYSEGWLVAKIILYAVMISNGLLYGPSLTRSRLRLWKAQADQNAPKDADTLVRSYNKQLSMFYVVQTLTLLLILYLSVFGPAKHPGDF